MRSSQCQGPSHQGLSKVLPKKPNCADQSCLANARAGGGPGATPSRPALITSARSCSAGPESCSSGTSPAQLGPSPAQLGLILLSWDRSCSAGTSPAQLGPVLLSWDQVLLSWDQVLLSWDRSCSAGTSPAQLEGPADCVAPP